MHIYWIYDFKKHFVGNIFKRAWAHFCSWMVSLFQSDTNTHLNVKLILFQTIQFSICTHFFLSIQLNGRTVLFQTIQFSICTHFFLSIQLNGRTVLFQTIQFSIWTKLNGFKYCYVSLTIQLKMSFVYTQLKDQTILFQTILFST